MEKINNKLRLSKQKLTSLPFRKIAPNIVTMLALCAGVTSIRYSIAENWAMAVICIFLAAFFDGLDGRVARMLKGSTKFGAELRFFVRLCQFWRCSGNSDVSVDIV